MHGLILPFRARHSAGAYQKIWTPAGSPLIVTSRRVQERLQAELGLPVELAMRYQHPSIAQVLERLAGLEVLELFVIPMFPHYAASSYETAVERVRELAARLAPAVRLRVQPPYYAHPDYITALMGSAQAVLQQGYDHLLFSFHGLPERHLRKADPTGAHCLARADCCETASPAHATCYRHQCFETVRAFAQRAGLAEESYSVAFQSRLGCQPWLQPASDARLAQLAAQGVKRVAVMCPAFVADCLETLEEMGLRGRQTFLEAGGREFHLIPCLNDHPLWLAALSAMVHTMSGPAA